jgi:hypothetical protein
MVFKCFSQLSQYGIAQTAILCNKQQQQQTVTVPGAYVSSERIWFAACLTGILFSQALPLLSEAILALSCLWRLLPV